jgi:hypothetical protein
VCEGKGGEWGRDKERERERERKSQYEKELLE